MILKIINIFKLIRINNIIIAMIAVLVSSAILKNQNFSILINILLTIIFTMAFGNVLNDILDIKIDNIAHPERPLPSRKITLVEAKGILACLFLLVILSSFYINNLANQVLYFFILPALYLYNVFLKKIPIIGNIIVASLIATLFLFTEIALFNSYHILIVPALLIFGLSFIREFLKDICDYEGDKQYRTTTFPVYFGKTQSIKIAIIFIGVFAILCLIPYYTQYYKLNYLLLLIFIIEIPLFLLVLLLLNNPDKKRIQLMAHVTKYMSLGGLLIILLSHN